MWGLFLLDHFLIRNPDLTALAAIQSVFNNVSVVLSLKLHERHR